MERAKPKPAGIPAPLVLEQPGAPKGQGKSSLPKPPGLPPTPKAEAAPNTASVGPGPPAKAEVPSTKTPGLVPKPPGPVAKAAAPPVAKAKAEGKSMPIPTRMGKYFGGSGARSGNKLREGGKYHRSHGRSREVRNIRRVVGNLQNFAGSMVAWTNNMEENQGTLQNWTAQAVGAMETMQNNMAQTSNHGQFLSHTIGHMMDKQEAADKRMQTMVEKAGCFQNLQSSNKKRLSRGQLPRIMMIATLCQ